MTPDRARARSRDRFRGRIAGVGTTSGVRVVVGHWQQSPLGAFSDVMLAEPDGRRHLLAPSREVADFVASTYTFDEVHVVPVTVTEEPGAWQVRAGIRLSQGRLRDAIEAWSHVPGTTSVALEPLPRDESEAADRVRAMLVAAREPRADEQLIMVGAYSRAILHAALGETDNALAELEQALEVGDGRVVLVRVEPAFAAVHGSPRFVELVSRAFPSG